MLDVPDTQPLPRLIEELRGFSLKQNAVGAAHSVHEASEDHGGEETREEDSSLVALWSADSGDGGEDNRLPMSAGRKEKGRRLVQVLSSQDTSSSEEAAPESAQLAKRAAVGVLNLLGRCSQLGAVEARGRERGAAAADALDSVAERPDL